MGHPPLSGLVSAWVRFNQSVNAADERRRLQKCLVRFLYGNRQADRLLRVWLAECLSACLEGALANEPTLRSDREAVELLKKACAVDARLARFTVGTFGGQGGASSHLNLLTLHSAKGLEFDVVVIMGLEDGRIPHYEAEQSDARMREERRLFYVGITRARHEVHLVCSGWYANRYGRVFRNGRSRFLDEVEAALA